MIFSLVLLATIVPALILAMLAVLNAVFVRLPQEGTTLPDIKVAVDIMDYFKAKQEIEPRLWLIYHPMVEAAIVRNERKSVRLHWAHFFYVLAVWSLLFPILAMFVSVPVAYYFSGHSDKPVEVKAK
jgi:hypothetical protein